MVNPRKKTRNKKTERGIHILSKLHYLLAVYWLAVSIISLLVLLGIANELSLVSYLLESVSPTVQSEKTLFFSALTGIVVGPLLSITYFVIAPGLTRKREWARITAIGLSIGLLILSLINVVNALIRSSLIAVIAGILVMGLYIGIIRYLFTNKEIKQSFT